MMSPFLPVVLQLVLAFIQGSNAHIVVSCEGNAGDSCVIVVLSMMIPLPSGFLACTATTTVPRPCSANSARADAVGACKSPV